MMDLDQMTWVGKEYMTHLIYIQATILFVPMAIHTPVYNTEGSEFTLVLHIQSENQSTQDA